MGKLAEEKLMTSGSPGTANAAFPPGMMGGLGGMDINNLLNNPSLMNMATSMMSDPSVQQMMGQFMSGGAAQGGAPAGGGMWDYYRLDNVLQNKCSKQILN